MRGIILTAVLGAAAVTGCYATGDVGYSATYTATASTDGYAATPDLVTVQPGVQVVADYDEPVFFVDGFYWRFNDGYWYRSNNYYSGWYFYERPPVAVLRIDRPYAYARYRPSGYVARRNVRYRPPAAIVDHRRPVVRESPSRAYVREAPSRGPVYAPPAAAVRDHRSPPPAAAPPARAPSPPAARDHRESRESREVRDHRR
jgi:hypothetical protein